MKNASISFDIELDRRNQQGECWLYDNEDGEFLTKFFEHQPFDLKRASTISCVIEWLRSQQHDVQVDSLAINQWLEAP